MKFFNLIFVILFLLFAAWQYNDPDPWLWIPIYLYAALLSALALRGETPLRVYIPGFLFLAGYAILLIIGENGVWGWLTRHGAESIVASMRADKPWIEETREFLGLLIILAVMAANIRGKKR